MKRINFFKTLLIVQTLALIIYTVYAIDNVGINLFAVAISNIKGLNWNGQFNLDFSCYLVLSGIWIMWREDFSIKSILFGIAAMILGIIFFAPYLFFVLIKENGDVRKLLIANR